MSIFRALDFIFLIVPIVYLGLRHYHIWILDNQDYKIRNTTLFALTLFVLYLVILIGVGPSALENHLSDYEKGKSFYGYIIPGFGFALAAFPYEASEFSEHYITITKGGINDIFAVFGWFMIFVLFMKLTVFSV